MFHFWALLTAAARIVAHQHQLPCVADRDHAVAVNITLGTGISRLPQEVSHEEQVVLVNNAVKVQVAVVVEILAGRNAGIGRGDEVIVKDDRVRAVLAYFKIILWSHLHHR